MKKVALLTLGLLLVCGSAFATPSYDDPTYNPEPYVFDDHHTIYANGRNDIIGEYFDKYQLNINYDTIELGARVDFYNLDTYPYDGYPVVNFSLFFYDEIGQIIKTSTMTVSTFLNSMTLSLSDVSSGVYYLGISGLLADSGGFYGAYNGIVFTSSPVPIPAALLLLSAGLLGIVGIRRRQIS